MNYRQQVTELVQAQVGTGMTLKEITEPLLNMVASAVVNICHNNFLDVENEKDIQHMTLDRFIETYEEAYAKQPIIN